MSLNSLCFVLRCIERAAGMAEACMGKRRHWIVSHCREAAQEWSTAIFSEEMFDLDRPE